MSVTIYGSSDDLIEIDGDLPREFNMNVAEGVWLRLGFSDGSLVKITYDGTWIVRVVTLGDGTDANHVANEGEDSDNYSDRLTLTARKPIEWAVLGLDE